MVNESKGLTRRQFNIGLVLFLSDLKSNLSTLVINAFSKNPNNTATGLEENLESSIANSFSSSDIENVGNKDEEFLEDPRLFRDNHYKIYQVEGLFSNGMVFSQKSPPLLNNDKFYGYVFFQAMAGDGINIDNITAKYLFWEKENPKDIGYLIVNVTMIGDGVISPFTIMNNPDSEEISQFLVTYKNVFPFFFKNNIGRINNKFKYLIKKVGKYTSKMPKGYKPDFPRIPGYKKEGPIDPIIPIPNVPESNILKDGKIYKKI